MLGAGATLVCSPCPVHCDTATTSFALTGRAVVLDGRVSSDDRGTPGTPTEPAWDTSNAPPTGAFTVATQGAAAEPDEAVTFDASTSTDPDGEIAQYAWDFGDGMPATGATVAHPFTTPGPHSVTLTVTDKRRKERVPR